MCIHGGHFQKALNLTMHAVQGVHTKVNSVIHMLLGQLLATLCPKQAPESVDSVLSVSCVGYACF